MPAALAEAREEILIAEGSDWFWWYGDDHSSAHDLEFDNLFRRTSGMPIAACRSRCRTSCSSRNISDCGCAAARPARADRLIAPTLDGEETSYFEWLGAGLLEVHEVAGAMHQVERRPAVVRRIQFGFGGDRLFVRIDVAGRALDLLADRP